MLAQRVGVAALRRGAKPGVFFNQNIARVALSTSQSRPAAITKHTPSEGNEILANQRLNRPVAPHLGIYKIEQTWFGHSAWTRITGCTLSGLSYLYFSSYLAAPLLGWHLESASLVGAFAAMPFLLKGGIKFALAFPFVFHFINGVRHLVFDLGAGFAKKNLAKAEIALWASSLIGGGYLAFGV